MKAKTSKGVLCTAVLCLMTAFLGGSAVWAALPPTPVSYPEATAQPLVDGLFTNAAEYAGAAQVTNLNADGTFYYQHTHDWAPPGKAVSYPDTITLFTEHDIWTYDALDAFDLNTFEIYYAGVKIVTYIFLPGDEPVDAWWLTAAGLQNSPLLDVSGNINDDGGFLVRVNDNPATDRQWVPGSPEPGDPGWNFGDYYGVFGKGAFTDSAYTTGMRTTPIPANENYEFSITFDDVDGVFWPPAGVPGVGGFPPEPDPDTPNPRPDCWIDWWVLVIEKVKDWKPSMGGWGNPGGIGWVPKLVNKGFVVPHPKPADDPWTDPNPSDLGAGQYVGPAGGIVTAPDGTSVTVPPGSVPAEEFFSLTDAPMVPDGLLPPGVDEIATTREIEAWSSEFLPPLEITIAYSDEEIESVEEGSLQALVFNEELEIWEPIPAAIDPAVNTATFMTDHLSIFGLGGLSKPAAVPTLPGWSVPLLLLLVAGLGVRGLMRMRRVHAES